LHRLVHFAIEDEWGRRKKKSPARKDTSAKSVNKSDSLAGQRN
jgi:hypothetical protein